MKAVETAEALTLKMIRKIIAAKGDLQGNFYAVQADRGLVVTLVAKDPKGIKALTLGKGLRKELDTRKFKRGTVTFAGSQLVFTTVKGNMPDPEFKKKMKTGFGDKKVKKYTFKARLVAEDGTVSDDGTAIAIEDVRKEVDAAGDLGALVAAQQQLGPLNTSLQQFLHRDGPGDYRSEDEILQRALKEMDDRIQLLLNKRYTVTSDPKERAADREELKRLRQQIVEDVHVGFEPTPDVGVLLSNPMRILMQHVDTHTDDELRDAKGRFPKQVEAALHELANDLRLVDRDEVRPDLIAKIKDFNLKVLEDDRLPVSLPKTHSSKDWTAWAERFYRRFVPPSEDTIEDGSWKRALHSSAIGSGEAYRYIESLYPTILQAFPRADHVRMNDGDCLAYLRDDCGSSWETCKHTLIDTEHDTPKMWQMVLFRKRHVDGVLRTQREASGGVLLAKAVGSTNLTSDYDLTLSTTNGSGYEITAIKAFNAEIKRVFGKQPGTVFDTNLYAKDFLMVKDTILDPGTRDGGGIEDVEGFLEHDRSDQDVASLVKMRQYMDVTTWQAFVDETLKGKGLKPEKKKEITLQFEEAEAVYLMKQREVWEAAVQAYRDAVADDEIDGIDEIDQLITAMEGWDTFSDGNLELMLKAQLKLEEAIETLHHTLPDLLLEVRNGLYMDHMEDVRKVQTLANSLDAAFSAVPKDEVEALQQEMEEHLLHGRRTEARELLDDNLWNLFGDDAELLTEDDKKGLVDAAERGAEGMLAWMKRKVDALHAQAKQEVGATNFFAAEAYLSEGPLQHIVFGNQSNNPAVFAKLKPEHFLESINEQFGDFCKDCREYGSNDGKALYQTAKYLSRMFEGIVKLSQKEGFADIEAKLKALKAFEVEGAADLMKQIQGKLMPIRGAKDVYADMSETKKEDAAISIADQIYGVETIAALKAKVTKLNAQINQVVRASLTLRPGLGDTQDMGKMRSTG